MIIINSDLESFISGSYNGKNFNIPYSEETYKTAKDLEKEAKAAKTPVELKPILDTFESIVNSFDYSKEVASKVGDLKYVPKTGKYHIAVGSGYSDIYVPDKLADLIMSNFERGIDSVPIVNMCRRFILNPLPTQKRFNMLANYVTQTYVDKKEKQRLMDEQGLNKDVAEKHATYMDMQITAEGYLKTSKVVNEITKKWVLDTDDDGKPKRGSDGRILKKEVDRYEVEADVDPDTGEVTEAVKYPEFLEGRKFTPAIYMNGDKFLSGDKLGYQYTIGELAALPSWDMVAMKDGCAHEKGLHTGGLAYVEGYINWSKNNLLLDVFVCPSQIGKFVNEGLGEMTCKEFFIYGAASMEGTTEGLYHTDSYAKIQSEDLKERLDAKAEELSKEFEGKQQEIFDMAEIAKALSL